MRNWRSGYDFWRLQAPPIDGRFQDETCSVCYSTCYLVLDEELIDPTDDEMGWEIGGRIVCNQRECLKALAEELAAKLTKRPGRVTPLRIWLEDAS